MQRYKIIYNNEILLLRAANKLLNSLTMIIQAKIKAAKKYRFDFVKYVLRKDSWVIFGPKKNDKT